eukprot:8339166-Alexandrium_andersonii.AAC.1
MPPVAGLFSWPATPPWLAAPLPLAACGGPAGLPRGLPLSSLQWPLDPACLPFGGRLLPPSCCSLRAR